MCVPLISIDRLTISYECPTVQEAVILDSASCEIFKCVIHFLQGPNGSGKTSFFKTLLGLQSPDLKFIKVAGCETRISGRQLACQLKVSYIPQIPGEALVPDLSIMENLYLRSVLISSRDYGHVFKWLMKTSTRKQIRGFAERLTAISQAQKILKGRHRDPYQSFSGGELQILNLAAVMSVDVDLLVMDEPTGKLDKKNKIAFWNSLAELLETKKVTVLSTTHEESFLQSRVVSYPYRLLKIDNKKIVLDGSYDGSNQV